MRIPSAVQMLIDIHIEFIMFMLVIYDASQDMLFLKIFLVAIYFIFLFFLIFNVFFAV